MNLSDLVGDFGRYQLWLNVLLFFCKYGMAFQYLAFSFLAPPITYTCPSGEKCCDDPNFNTTEFERTLQTQWNLICDREWLLNLTETLFKCGMSFGSVTLGMACDEYGRRITIIVAAVTETISGNLAALSHYDYWVFTILRMITGYSIGGLMVVAFIILIESVGTKSRDLCSAVHQLTFTLGHLSLAIIGYFVRDFVRFQLIISSFNFILFVYICSMPESPRWLLAVGRTDEAIKLLEKEARFNKLPTQHIKSYVTNITSNHQYRRQTITDLCSSKKLTWYIVVISLNWFTCNYYFFGVSPLISNMAGDVFTQVLLVAVVGNIGVLLSVPLMAHMGRVSLMIFANIICGACSISDAFISGPKTSAFLSIIGIMFNCVVFVVIFVQCCEIFPTVLRGTALGIASMTACLGSIIAPYTQYLRPFGDWCEQFAYGMLPLLVALLYFTLPETKALELPDTIAESRTPRLRRRVVIAQRATSITSATGSHASKKSTAKPPSLKSSQPVSPPTAAPPPPTEPARLSDLIRKTQSADPNHDHD